MHKSTMHGRYNVRASEVVAKIQELMAELGGDPEVLGQSHGCCYHGHYVREIVAGTADDELGDIVIRV